jgi:hypothetical protein
VTRRRQEEEREASGADGEAGWRRRGWAFSVPFAWRRRRVTEATAMRAAPGLCSSAALGACLAPWWTIPSATCV